MNLGPETVKLDLAFGPAFRATVDGKELPMSIKFEAPPARRGIKATLKPGQYVGGRVPLASLVDLSKVDGPVRVTWSMPLEDEAGKLVSLPIRMTVKK